MKTNAFALAWVLSASFLVGCGSGGGLVGPATPPAAGSRATAAGTTGGTTARATRQLRTTANAQVEKPQAADAFVDSIGVDVHLFYTWTAYGNDFPAFASLLIASGIRHIRDGVIDTDWQPYYDHLNALGEAGIHADLITSVNQSVGLISSYPARVRSSIESFEAPNEYDRSGDPNWAVTLASFQRRLYSAVSSRYPVVGPSLTREASYAAAGDLSGSLDFGNMHDYLEGHNPGTSGWGQTDAFGTFASIAWNMGVAAQVSKSKAIEATETGYGDAGRYAVPPAVKAKYTLRSLFEHFNRGVRRVYLYEFLDEGFDGFDTYGLVTSTLSPKPAYVAVKTLIGLLADKGADFTPAPLSYGLEVSSDVHHTLLQKRDGTYALALWIEEPGSDPATDLAITVPAQTATLNFPNAPKSLSAATIGDDGNATPLSVAPGTSVDVPISDHVTIVDFHF